MDHAQIHMMANVGHAPFWDDSQTVNERLRAFWENVASQENASDVHRNTIGVRDGYHTVPIL